ncbi:hypothetical protein [Nonomuraea sp. NPDC049646]|uniref:hypothetical protein n=1 Tax=unclassified Nonomuraea TaxID=2593643 RepID=UPI00378819C7
MIPDALHLAVFPDLAGDQRKAVARRRVGGGRGEREGEGCGGERADDAVNDDLPIGFDDEGAE